MDLRLRSCITTTAISTFLCRVNGMNPLLSVLTSPYSQLQSTLFSTTFNPTNARLGNKVLRQRLKGPALAAYYPRKSATVEDIQKEFAKFDLVTWNEEEEDRLEGLQIAKLRGKGAPKKKRTADGEFYGRRRAGAFADREGEQQARRERRKRGDGRTWDLLGTTVYTCIGGVGGHLQATLRNRFGEKVIQSIQLCLLRLLSTISLPRNEIPPAFPIS